MSQENYKYTIHGFQQMKLIKHGLNNNDALLMAVIKDMYASNSVESLIHNEERYIWANQKYMSLYIPILGSHMTTHRVFSKLKDKGVLNTVTLNSRNGKSGKYFYVKPSPLMDELSEYTNHLGVNLQSDNRSINKNANDQLTKMQYKDTPTTDTPTNDNNTNAHSSKYSVEFERWWSIYPRKQGKGKAYANWKREKLDSRVDELIEKLQQQVAMEYAFTEIGYIPHGSTYLNESRYDDDVIPKRVNNERSGNNNPKGESYKEFATELSNRVDKNRHIYDELPDDHVF